MHRKRCKCWKQLVSKWSREIQTRDPPSSLEMPEISRDGVQEPQTRSELFIRRSGSETITGKFAAARCRRYKSAVYTQLRKEVSNGCIRALFRFIRGGVRFRGRLNIDDWKAAANYSPRLAVPLLLNLIRWVRFICRNFSWARPLVFFLCACAAPRRSVRLDDTRLTLELPGSRIGFSQILRGNSESTCIEISIELQFSLDIAAFISLIDSLRVC